MLLSKLISATSNYTNLQLLASQLPSGCARLQYGNPPHVSDAIELVAEARKSIQSNTIAACWRRAKCLPQMEEDVSHDTAGEQERAEIAQEEMQQNILQLNPEAPATVALLKAHGLDDLAIATHSLQSTASEMLRQWLCLEEEVVVNVEDDHTGTAMCSDEDDSATEELRPLDKVAKLQEVLPLIHKLHKLGVVLQDSTILNKSFDNLPTCC